MKNLLYKEFKLALHPMLNFFLLSAVLLLIPSWPFFIAFGYLFIAIMNMFFFCKANQDTVFTVSLPIRKRDIVKARVFTIAIFELLQVIAAVPFAILHNVIYGFENGAGMNLNVAFFGCVLVMYALFNLALFPMFYKNGYKPGVPLLVGVLASLVFIAVVETAIHTVPFFESNFNPLDGRHLVLQLPVLAVGMGLFALLTALSFRMAAKNFEKVDL